MKRILCFFVLMLLLPSGIHAQNLYGFHGGPNYPNARIRGIDGYIPDPKIVDGFNLGVHALFPIDDHLSFYTAVSYQRNGFSLGVKDTLILSALPEDIPVGIRFDFFLDYIQIPVLLKYRFNPYSRSTAYINGGLYGGYHTQGFVRTKIRAIIDFNISSTPLPLTSGLFNRYDLGWMANIGYQIPIRYAILHFEARYHRSLIQWLHNPILAVDIKHHGFGFLLGISFPLGQKKAQQDIDRA